MTPDQIEAAASALVAEPQGFRDRRAAPEAAPAAIRGGFLCDPGYGRRKKLGESFWRIGRSGISPEGGHFAAPIYASRIAASPTAMPASGFHVIGIECEIGFRLEPGLGRSRAQPYTRDEVLKVASMHPTIEVVDSRYSGFPLARPASGARR